MVREIAETIILTVVIFLLVRQAVQNFKVSGISMMPTVQTSDLVLINKVDYLLESPQVGDVVVFKAPPEPSQDYIKRVIGTPGDLVQVIKDRGVWVNHHKLSEPYLNRPKRQCATIGYHLPGCAADYNYGPKRVPPGEYFVLGDNRNNSYDSHVWGYVPRANIVGKALVAYWPFSDRRFFSL